MLSSEDLALRDESAILYPLRAKAFATPAPMLDPAPKMRRIGDGCVEVCGISNVLLLALLFRCLMVVLVVIGFA